MSGMRTKGYGHRTIDREAVIRAGCQVLGIPLDPSWLPAIVENLHVLQFHVELLMTPPLPDHLNPGPVFIP